MTKAIELYKENNGWVKESMSIIQGFIAEVEAVKKDFQDYKDVFESLYLNYQGNYLSQINYKFIINICKILGINTKISWSMDYTITEGKTDRLVSLCKQAGATEYISGPSAKEYIDDKLFQQANITLSYIDYSNYPEHHQLFPSFEHSVSIIDLLFNEGYNSTKYMKSFI